MAKKLLIGSAIVATAVVGSVVCFVWLVATGIANSGINEVDEI